MKYLVSFLVILVVTLVSIGFIRARHDIRETPVQFDSTFRQEVLEAHPGIAFSLSDQSFSEAFDNDSERIFWNNIDTGIFLAVADVGRGADSPSIDVYAEKISEGKVIVTYVAPLPAPLGHVSVMYTELHGPPEGGSEVDWKIVDFSDTKALFRYDNTWDINAWSGTTGLFGVLLVVLLLLIRCRPNKHTAIPGDPSEAS